MPKGQFLWNNQDVVHLMVPGVREPWATVRTKRLAGRGPGAERAEGSVPTRRRRGAGRRAFAGHDNGDRDQVKLRFVTTNELHDGTLAAFLKSHLEAVQGAAVG